ncbi:Crp/Fnr family transcriptional regulator [Christensenella minuta]|nr:Crp/Fnr family transcriptional regulator [Christensenella minuta]MDY3751002.1 Crp/Fnr family transcriptional regulator [Christensenella minuta]
MMEQYFEILQKNELFEGTDEAELRSMLSCLGYTVRQYPKNDMIWNVGAKAQSFGIVLCGQAQVIREDWFGMRSIIAAIPPGGVFGEAFACAGIPRSPVAVRAGADSAVLFLSAEKLLTVCSSACGFHSRLIRRLTRMLALKNIELNRKIEFMSRRTTKEKLEAYLLSEYGRQKSNPFLIALDRAELADYLGVDRSAMSRELSRMKREGVIDYWKNSFKILDFETIRKS